MIYEWAIPEKKTTRGGWGQTFLKKFLEFLGFLLHPSKLQINKVSRLETTQNCVSHPNFKA